MTFGIWMAIFVGIRTTMKVLPGNFDALNNDMICHANLIPFGSNFEFRHKSKPGKLVGFSLKIDFKVAIIRKTNLLNIG